MYWAIWAMMMKSRKCGHLDDDVNVGNNYEHQPKVEFQSTEPKDSHSELDNPDIKKKTDSLYNGYNRKLHEIMLCRIPDRNSPFLAILLYMF